MNRQIRRLVAVAAMVVSLSAHAQLTSADNGAAATDRSGLMWANTVGIDLGWSASGVNTNTAQAWVTSLNTSHYGGYNDWRLATGDGSVGANTTSNQLGELFYTDCGNSVGQSTVLNNAGKKCGALSTLNSAISTPSLIFSSTAAPAFQSGGDTAFWVFGSANSSQMPWTNDTVFQGKVGLGDALAVRETPEIDPASAASGVTLLLGCVAVLRGRRKVVA
jgi:hypothetical protein